MHEALQRGARRRAPRLLLRYVTLVREGRNEVRQDNGTPLHPRLVYMHAFAASGAPPRGKLARDRRSCYPRCVTLTATRMRATACSHALLAQWVSSAAWRPGLAWRGAHQAVHTGAWAGLATEIPSAAERHVQWRPRAGSADLRPAGLAAAHSAAAVAMHVDLCVEVACMRRRPGRAALRLRAWAGPPASPSCAAATAARGACVRRHGTDVTRVHAQSTVRWRTVTQAYSRHLRLLTVEPRQLEGLAV